MSQAPLHVAFITSEMTPFMKTGGLADVSAALPRALARLGVPTSFLGRLSTDGFGRALANRLVGILHGCLRRRCLYDEAVAWPQPLKEAA